MIELGAIADDRLVMLVSRLLDGYSINVLNGTVTDVTLDQGEDQDRFKDHLWRKDVSYLKPWRHGFLCTGRHVTGVDHVSVISFLFYPFHYFFIKHR